MEKTYDEDETDRKNAKPEPKSHGGTPVNTTNDDSNKAKEAKSETVDKGHGYTTTTDTSRATRDREDQIRNGAPLSDAEILANTPPVPQADKLSAIKRDEDAHGGMTARDRVEHPEREHNTKTK